jgi:aryl sulfotransferase
MLTRPRDEVVAELEAQRHRRFIKTHTPLDGVPWNDHVTYIDVGRDPRDVAMSMGNHMENLDFDKFMAALVRTASVDGGTVLPPPGPPDAPPGTPTDRGRFWMWVDNPVPPTEETSSLLRTLRHHETFWNARSSCNVVMLHYDDLQTDLGGQMRALADRLEIAVPASRWDELVEAATFEQMRGNASTLAPNTDSAIWHDDTRFFHRHQRAMAQPARRRRPPALRRPGRAARRPRPGGMDPPPSLSESRSEALTPRLPAPVRP